MFIDISELTNNIKEFIKGTEDINDWIYIFTPYLNFNNNEYDNECESLKLVAYNLYVNLVKQDIIPKKFQYDLLMCIYQWGDVDKNFKFYLKKAYTNLPLYKKDEYKNQFREKLANNIDINGDIILYRGASTESIDIINACSFSTEFICAKHFAEHSLMHSKNSFSFIYTVRLNINDVIWYGDNRDESEVVIIPYCYGTKFKILNIKVFDIDDYKKEISEKIKLVYK